MKPRYLADIITAYGAALSSVGARSQADTLAKLAQALTTGPGATVAAVLKRWNGVSFEATSSRPTLGDTANLLRPLSDIMRVGGKAAATDLSAVTAFLQERAAVSLVDLVDRSGAAVSRALRAPKARTPKSAPPFREVLVNEHVRRLREAASDEPRFTVAFDQLSDLSLPELVAVAKGLTGAGPRTKNAANKKIWAFHQAISGFDAKVRATGGRSAA